MEFDYRQLMHSESLDLADLLDSLSADQWEAPSLCEGWRVKDVVAHMVVGHTRSVLAFGAAVARRRLRVDRASYDLARSYADTHPVGEISAGFREGTQGRARAAARLVPMHELFTDHLVHHQDIRRPLALPRTIPTERLLAALCSLPRLSRRVGSRQRMSGLLLAATDVAFRQPGGGLELRGPAESLVMALTGRSVALVDLSGPGVPTLADRLAAPPPSEPRPVTPSVSLHQEF